MPRWIAPPHIPPPPVTLLGNLDTPSEGSKVIGETVLVAGWALNDEHAASRVEIFLDGVSLGRARLGIERADLEAAGFRGDASFAGYELTSVLPERPDGPAILTAVAWFAGDTKRLEMGPRSFTTNHRAGDSAGTRTTRTHPSPPRAAAGSRLPTVLVVTHQLDLGGGQLYLQELLLKLQKKGLFRFVVVSPVDGVLRPQLEAEGIEVHLTSPWPLDNVTMYEDRITELVTWARDMEVAAVLANTVVAFPGIHIASRLHVPSVWAIHESYPQQLLWDSYFGYGHLDPMIQASALAALDQADLLVFEAEATRALFATAERESRCVVVQYGVDMAAIDAAAPTDRATARQMLGIPKSARVILCMGRFERRKAQLSIIQAFQMVAPGHRDALLVLVGDDGNLYANLVRRIAEESALGDQLRLEKVTSESLNWYRGADILLSASDIESMPRSAFEAMALGSPVLAAAVYGFPELIDDGVTGWLFRERDVEALADGLERALSTSPEELIRMGARASERVRMNHDSAGYAAAYGDIFQRLTAESAQTPGSPITGGVSDIDTPTMETYNAVRSYTMTTLERVAALCEAVRYVTRHGVPGDLVECGVWRGGSMLAAARTLLEQGDRDRTLWLYDTFAGMPEPTEVDIRATDGAPATVLLANRDRTADVWAVSPLDEVKRVMALCDYPAEKIRYIQGKVEDTIPATAPQHIAILRLDTDWYESTHHELIHLLPRVSPGGVLIIDDYGFWRGSRRAVDEYLAATKARLLLNRIDDSGRIAVMPS